MQLNLPEVHGFKGVAGVGPNPKGNGKALNVWLTPVTPENAEKMRRAGRTAIQGCQPLTQEQARDFVSDPLGAFAESALGRVLRPCLAQAKVVNEA